MTTNIPLPQGVNLTVIKQNIQGQETWRYHGRLVHQDDHSITLEAFFDREDIDLHGLPLKKGDRFVETYYTDRWYNIFEIHAREDDRVRGWYCNIAQPAQIDGNTISYIDLALDLLVFPDSRQLVLDEDEFAALNLSDDLRSQVRQALSELQAFLSNDLAENTDPGEEIITKIPQKAGSAPHQARHKQKHTATTHKEKQQHSH